jgi:hypothetical protein
VKVVVNPAIGSNIAPVVNAGADKVISLPVNSVSLTGTASDSDGTIASYSWIKLSGGNASLSGASTATLTASSLSAGEYVFQLTVKDDDGASKSDDVKVIVNASPTVTAGADKLISLPTNYVTLYGSASDSDGTISSFSWSKISGGAATLSGATTKTLSISGLVAGTYVFRMTAKDNLGATTSDDVTVVVNVPPVPNAGTNKTITLPLNSVSLPGSGSDPDGTIATYAWTKISGGAATLSGTTTATLSVTGMAAGSYEFRLTVTDNRGSSRYDNVTVLVNIPPAPNAGSDRTLLLPSNSLVLSGSASDADGYIKYYSWTKVSGGSASMSGNSTASLNLTGLAAGSYVFRLTVTDNNSAAKYDDVVVTVTSSTSGSAFSDAEVVTFPADDGLEVEDDALSGSTDCGDCKVVIYNEKLERIYDAAWVASREDDVFSSRGFYYYKVVRDGKVIRGGKIFRQ